MTIPWPISMSLSTGAAQEGEKVLHRMGLHEVCLLGLSLSSFVGLLHTLQIGLGHL